MPIADEVDSDFLRTTAVNMQVPGEQTHKDLTAQHPQFRSPTYWDQLSKSSDETDKWMERKK
jgi:hypothetical protein